MGDPSRADRLAYRAKLDQRTPLQIIGDLAGNGWTAASGIMGVIGALESAHGLVTTGAASIASKFSIYTLPISTFLLGTSIRIFIDESDDSKDDARQASRSLILLEAFRDATEKHFQKYPNSILRDDSRPNRLIVLSDSKYSNVNPQIEGLFREWWIRLNDEIQKLQDGTAGAFAGETSFVPDDSNPLDWKSFVYSRFYAISARYTAILEYAEWASRYGRQ